MTHVLVTACHNSQYSRFAALRNINIHTLQQDNHTYLLPPLDRVLTLKIKIDFINFQTRLITTIFGRAPLSRLLEYLITWVHQVIWQIQSNKKSTSSSLWPPNLRRWGFIVKTHNSLSLVTVWSHGQVKMWQMK